MISLEVLLIVVAVIIGLIFLARFLALRVWAEAKAMQLPVGLLHIVGMRLRGTSPSAVIRPAVIAKAAETPIDLSILEAHTLAGGDAHRLVRGVVQAKKMDVDVSIDELAEADLAGTDPLEVVARRAKS